MPSDVSLPRRLGGVLAGLALSVPVHLVGLGAGIVAGVVLGLGSEGPWPQRTQSLFLVSFGLWQWLYLLPLVLLLRRKSPWIAAGLGLSGGVGLFVSFAGALSLLFRP